MNVLHYVRSAHCRNQVPFLELQASHFAFPFISKIPGASVLNKTFIYLFINLCIYFKGQHVMV